MLERLRSIAAVLILCAGIAPASLGQEHSPYIKFWDADPEMAAAQAKARARLSEFWRAFEHPGLGEDGFALKVAVPVGANSTEHIWIANIEREAGKITGVVNNAPRNAKGLRSGQRIEIAEDRISDWMFMRAGKIVGNQTMRPALKRMPPEEAARFRAMLEEP